jgi:uncharacterized protein
MITIAHRKFSLLALVCCERMDAIRFRCIPGCTNCCTRRGFVYLTGADLHRAAEYLGLTPQEFESKFVYRTRHLLRLRVPKHSGCHFLRDGGCSIHPAKPTQCRLYPFWPELVENPKEWAKEAKFCPGIGTGRLVQIGTAVGTAGEMKAAYPFMYGKS